MSIIIDYLILWECPQNPLSKAQSQIHSISSYYYSLNLMSFYLSTADSTGFISPDFVIFSSNHGTVQYTKIHIIKQKKLEKYLEIGQPFSIRMFFCFYYQFESILFELVYRKLLNF